nr:MAG TPA: hypothetical protein [Caudoviricetes sp.]
MNKPLVSRFPGIFQSLLNKSFCRILICDACNRKAIVAGGFYEHLYIVITFTDASG